MEQPKSISTKKLILAEGRDAELFLVWAARSFRPQRDFQVMDFGGVTDLHYFLSQLVNVDGYDDVETIVVARDAEENAKSAVESVQSAMRQAGMPVPTKAFEYTQNVSPKFSGQ